MRLSRTTRSLKKKSCWQRGRRSIWRPRGSHKPQRKHVISILWSSDHRYATKAGEKDLARREMWLNVMHWQGQRLLTTVDGFCSRTGRRISLPQVLTITYPTLLAYGPPGVSSLAPRSCAHE